MGTSPYPHRCADLACCLLLPRSPESRSSRSAHHLHALLGSEQPGSLGRSEVPAPSCGQHNSAGGGVVGSLIDGPPMLSTCSRTGALLSSGLSVRAAQA